MVCEKIVQNISIGCVKLAQIFPKWDFSWVPISKLPEFQFWHVLREKITILVNFRLLDLKKVLILINPEIQNYSTILEFWEF